MTAATGFRVPFVIGFTGEVERHHPLMWMQSWDGMRLAYDALPSRGDYSHGVLRLRQSQKRTGRPDFKTVNTRRQWRCMEKRLCQVCGRSAVDRDTGRTWWLLSSTGDGDYGDGYTNAPPTCRACIPEAIAFCPHLRRNAEVFTVGRCSLYGVRADVFLPYLAPIQPAERNVVLRFDDYSLPHAIARELLVRLSDVQPAQIGVHEQAA
ncbi:hypothetical protein [Nonomuraea sp. NPDC046570]|uniref:hypothetical protein n=1 Tax=Nonomuraea sp. NPDC046570 TaxID=3155255 RepID=UPI0033D2E380